MLRKCLGFERKWQEVGQIAAALRLIAVLSFCITSAQFRTLSGVFKLWHLWTDKNPHGLIRIRRKFAENTLRIVQADEFSDSAWAVLFRQWHGKREGCAHWRSLLSA
jgi:hypothetical protein